MPQERGKMLGASGENRSYNYNKFKGKFYYWSLKFKLCVALVFKVKNITFTSLKFNMFNCNSSGQFFVIFQQLSKG